VLLLYIACLVFLALMISHIEPAELVTLKEYSKELTVVYMYSAEFLVMHGKCHSEVARHWEAQLEE